MAWIEKGCLFVNEIEDTFQTKVDVVKVSDFNAGKGRDYPYWESIKHPETGEILSATQGYMGMDNNTCYYAEYQNAQGKTFYYTRNPYTDESIFSQQIADREEYKQRLQYSEKRNQFSNILKGTNMLDNESASIKVLNQYITKIENDK